MRSVTLRYPAEHGLSALSVTANVVGNMFVASTGRARNGAYPPTIVWHFADHTKTISPGSP